jgi:AcrR family transcriptional regulator
MVASNVYTVTMTQNDNSVNIESRPYHHGDLRAALIAEGLRLLGERDAEALSLREVARNVGVSATAVYRHFPDKEALTKALAQEGLARLAAAQHAAADAAGGGEEGFTATGRAYVRFALANPALFRLIFTTPRLSPWSTPAGEESEAMAFLRANAAASVGRDGGSREATVRAVNAWALVHGLAMLMLDGQIPADQGLIDAVIC